MKNRKLRKTNWLEWGILIIAILVYCQPFLQFGPASNLPGNESEYFQTFDQILENSVKQYGQFPLWNPYYFSGIPYAAHPMLHAFNPLISLPVLIFGTMDGFKLAVFLGFVVAGLGMWWLGQEMGLSAMGRMWIALMYVFSGIPAAKFIQGHYLLVFGFGWIPFSLAAILATRRSKQRKFIYIAALGLALLFLSGNGYYPYYMLYVVGIFGAIQVFSKPQMVKLTQRQMFSLFVTWGSAYLCLAGLGIILLFFTENIYYAYYLLVAIALVMAIAILSYKNSPLQMEFRWNELKVLLIIGSLALCLSAVQLLPSLEYRERYNKDINVKLSDSQNPSEIFQDFISPEPFRPGAYSRILRPEEFYAYTGWWPLIGILGLPLAWKRGGKRNIILVLSLILFTLAWIDVRDMPWNNLFQTLPVLYQFRYPSRMVVIGGMALITAGGLGLDALRRLSQKLWQNGHRQASGLLTLGLGVFVLWSPINLANTCRPLLSPTAPIVVHNQVATWLKQYDPGQYYVQAPNGWDQALIGNQLRYLNGGYGLHYLAEFKNQISERKIELVPKYVIMLNDSPAPDNAHLIKTFANINIYRMTAVHSLKWF